VVAPLIVAIDGPSGVGKSTTARLLARRLGVPYLDTGAMYRALGLRVIEAGVDPDDHDRVLGALAGARLELRLAGDGQAEVLLDGAPVGGRIRTPEVGEATSKIATYPEVRGRLVTLQRELAERHGGVIEGRDIGTEVVPDTPHKFYFDAAEAVRVRRRFEELRRAGRAVSEEAVAQEVRERDRRDRTRAASPLVATAGHLRLDTSGATPEQLVEAMLAAIRSRAGR
jgi:cytidylate kinase